MNTANFEVLNPLLRREQFAVGLRKNKKIQILNAKRQILYGN